MSTALQQSVTPSINATTGLWTFTFPPVSQGQVAQVSIAVPAGPSTVTWMVYVGGQAVGAMPGSTAAGPFTIPGGSALTVTATPPSGTTSLTAVMIGSQGNPDEFTPQTPAAAGNAPPAPFALDLTVLYPNAVNNWSVTPSPLASGLLIVAGSSAPLNSVVATPLGGPPGGQTLTLPFSTIVPFATPGLEPLQLYYVPVLSGSYGAGTWTYVLNFLGPNWGFVYEVDSGQFPFAASAILTPSANTITVPSPSPGADWSYTLLMPARVRAIWARLTTAVAAATRYPDLIVSTPASAVITYLPMSAAGVAASTTQDVAMGPGMGPLTSVTETGVDVKCMVGFPDVMLPIGTVIKSSTTNIQAADQWAPIELTLSSV